MTLRNPRPTDSEAAARVLSCSCEGKLATVWVGRRHARHVGGLRRGEAEEGGRVGTRLSSHLRAPPTLPPDPTSHLLPAYGVESGAGGVGHRPGGTEQGSAVGGKAGRTLSSWADICPPSSAWTSQDACCCCWKKYRTDTGRNAIDKLTKIQEKFALTRKMAAAVGKNAKLRKM